MIELRRKPVLQRVFVCDACGLEIATRHELLLLRSPAALPEEAAYHVHRACADRFEQARGGRWQRILPSSPSAAWLL